MAGRRSLAIAAVLTALLAVGLTDAAAADVTITVVQIRAQRGGGKQDIDKRLRALERKLASLPYSKFEYVGRYTATTAPGKVVAVRLAEGMLLRATPTVQGERIAVQANLFKNNNLVVSTSLVVRPAQVGFLIHSAAPRDTILAVTVQ